MMDKKHWNATHVSRFEPAEQVHELLTFGGLVSPLKRVADMMFQQFPEAISPPETKEELRRIIAEAHELLQHIITTGQQAGQTPLTPEGFITFYHERFREWKRVLEQFVSCADSILAQLPSTHVYRQQFQGAIEKLQAFRTIQEIPYTVD